VSSSNGTKKRTWRPPNTAAEDAQQRAERNHGDEQNAGEVSSRQFV
jgi:hypothetical protein